MLHFLNYLLGYVYIEVRGAYPERFLNLLAHDSIVFWDMTRPEIDVLRIRVAASDYKRMRICARRAMCHMHILAKNGLPFFAHKYKRRGALVAGLVLFCAIAWVMSSFVWIIDIKGDGVDAAQIRDELKQNGVYIGARRSKINVNELKNDMLLRLPDLSYIALNLDGSRAEVIARKRTKPPKIEAVDTPSNIIAKRAGVISSVVVTSGMPEVAVGDAVMPGDLLAGGYMTGRHGTTVMMRSVGTIRAKTLHTIAAKYPMDTLVKNYSGKRCTRRTLIFGHNRINLFFSTGNPYVTCDKMIKSVYLTLP
ncbi:MAG: sporulation protein YqfD, partial [Clostridia bacterium]